MESVLLKNSPATKSQLPTSTEFMSYVVGISKSEIKHAQAHKEVVKRVMHIFLLFPIKKVLLSNQL